MIYNIEMRERSDIWLIAWTCIDIQSMRAHARHIVYHIYNVYIYQTIQAGEHTGRTDESVRPVFSVFWSIQQICTQPVTFVTMKITSDIFRSGTETDII